MADKYVAIAADGRKAEVEATVTSAGVADAGEIPALDAAGKLDASLLPVGVGPDVTNMPSFEDLASGDYVNTFLDGGVIKARLADNSNDRPAHGYVKAGVTAPASVNVFFEGANANVSGRTIGARQYLGTVGSPVEATPTGAGTLLQFLGTAISATEINTDIDDETVRA